jgi:helix-turn-helix protein
MNAIAEDRRRFGYRTIGILLRREGFVVNHKRVYCVYREEGNAVPKEAAADWLVEFNEVRLTKACATAPRPSMLPTFTTTLTSQSSAA